MDDYKIIELIKICKEGDKICWVEPNGEVFVIKIEKKYPKDWEPPKRGKTTSSRIRRR